MDGYGPRANGNPNGLPWWSVWCGVPGVLWSQTSWGWRWIEAALGKEPLSAIYYASWSELYYVGSANILVCCDGCWNPHLDFLISSPSNQHPPSCLRHHTSPHSGLMGKRFKAKIPLTSSRPGLEKLSIDAEAPLTKMPKPQSTPQRLPCQPGRRLLRRSREIYS